MTDDFKKLIREEYGKICSNTKLADRLADKVSEIAILPSGEIITVGKQSIIRDFYFGESGYDYDDVVRMARHASKSEEYFLRKNMECFDRMITEITDSMTRTGNYRFVVWRDGLCRIGDCRIRNLEAVRVTDIIDSLGGTAFIEDLPGKTVIIRGHERRILTDDEHRIILEAYCRASEAHRKKVAAYLKRYGTSKVTARTYWIDA